ncbi:hypothetical protein GUITHDRAFT_120835 [Guillardia theta CCMP2712]|uniref:Uncharacterized protein n=1 Tax=Guillardia theta (strain CCMP2712) TaxID=905079 RepID=L1IA71_GUITC|nr:hypothetical protein GUITHDRAFT_120835 [Guillardia theta CCMP2712]EKX33002.1 hypothetical protein GUITHDRAFT_120835 [Guillardia theta CCMP2712]|eukprot:XP_005819982.1 hypothetical protein GUITHDRAFT_120835 [Guillardia theta CCMP2712]
MTGARSLTHARAVTGKDPWKIDQVWKHYNRSNDTLEEMTARLNQLSDLSCSQRQHIRLTSTNFKMLEQRERMAFLRQTIINRNASVLSEQVKLKPKMRSFEVEEVKEIRGKEKEIQDVMQDIIVLAKRLEQTEDEVILPNGFLAAGSNAHSKIDIHFKSDNVSQLQNEINWLREAIDAKAARIQRQPCLRMPCQRKRALS